MASPSSGSRAAADSPSPYSPRSLKTKASSLSGGLQSAGLVGGDSAMMAGGPQKRRVEVDYALEAPGGDVRTKSPRGAPGTIPKEEVASDELALAICQHFRAIPQLSALQPLVSGPAGSVSDSGSGTGSWQMVPLGDDRNVYLDMSKVQRPPGRRAEAAAGADHTCDCDSCGIPARCQLPVVSLDLGVENPCPVLAISHCTFCYDSFLEEIYLSQKDHPTAHALTGVRRVFALTMDHSRLAPLPMEWIRDQRRALKDTVDSRLRPPTCTTKKRASFFLRLPLARAMRKRIWQGGGALSAKPRKRRPSC